MSIATAYTMPLWTQLACELLPDDGAARSTMPAPLVGRNKLAAWALYKARGFNSHTRIWATSTPQWLWSCVMFLFYFWGFRPRSPLPWYARAPKRVERKHALLALLVGCVLMYQHSILSNEY
eukprot:726303-Prymnesium_polylepis.1